MLIVSYTCMIWDRDVPSPLGWLMTMISPGLHGSAMTFISESKNFGKLTITARAVISRSSSLTALGVHLVETGEIKRGHLSLRNTKHIQTCRKRTRVKSMDVRMKDQYFFDQSFVWEQTRTIRCAHELSPSIIEDRSLFINNSIIAMCVQSKNLFLWYL